MRNARKQNGTLYLDKNGSRSPVWMFSWQHILPNGQRARKKRQVGSLDQYKTEAAAERAVLRIPVMWALDSGDVGRRRSEATLVEFYSIQVAHMSQEKGK